MLRRIQTSLTHYIHQLIRVLGTLPTKWYLIIIAVLAASVRLVSLTKASIWRDEGFTMMLIKFDVFDIIERTAQDVHPPLYYILTHYWQGLFGDSELAVRGLSLVFGVATVILVYFLIRRLFSENAARLAGLFVALGPFVVRYSEEARMYSLAALFVVLSTYLLVRALEFSQRSTKNSAWKYWLGYGIIIAASLYTHYFTALIIPVHIAYAIWIRGGITPLLGDKKWLAGNALGAVLFIPWLPVLYSQVSRVQSGFWIPAVSDETIPNTFMQFLAFTPNALPLTIELLTTVALIAYTIYAIKRARGSSKTSLLLLASWVIMPIVIVALLSLKQPIYYDRYFVFSSVAFYSLLACLLITGTWFKKRIIATASIVLAICIIFIAGIFSVHAQANHKMRDAGSYVNSHFVAGDTLVAAELYTYFDFSYYNKTGAKTLILSRDPLGSYGETSLIYDKQDSIRIADFTQLPKNATRVWVIGKIGHNDYFDKDIPAGWTQIDHFSAGDSVVRLYRLPG